MDYKNRLIEAAKAGGEVTLRYFGCQIETIEKSMAADFKTRADDEAEEEIVQYLSSKYPNYNILAEERGLIDKGSEYTFVIDPLDGTNNFLLGIPLFSTSIALVKGSEIIAGAIYQPVLDSIYYGESKRGSSLNGRKLAASPEVDLSKSTIAFTCGYKYPKDKIDLTLSALRPSVKRVIVNWSPAFDFCLLAGGKIEAVISLGIESYDFMAGKIIASEAGAIITDLNSSQTEKSINNSFFLASGNPGIEEKIISLLQSKAHSSLR